MPEGVDGLVSAANVAKDMVRTFPAIRVGLMVGIGGGIPDLRRGVDIRLGDVVVSRPEKTFGGVIQYDKGKSESAGKFTIKGQLNRPPDLLLNTVAQLRARHAMRPNKVTDYILLALEQNPMLEENGFALPVVSDHLHCPVCNHDIEDPTAQCSEPHAKRKQRRDRNPVVHYGTIASGNQVIKDALQRDALRDEFDVLCVEMEAAGLMNNYPCLVIRGICDYADMNKNDMWHPYAAMTAAAFTKELLSMISPIAVNASIKVIDLMNDTHGLVQKSVKLQQEAMETNRAQFQNTEARERTTSMRQWLRAPDASIDYNNVQNKCHAGTGQWLIESSSFSNWLQQDNAFLWLYGFAGCGKSVLCSTAIKYTLDYVRAQSETAMAFFFFTFNDDSKQNASSALRALLFQLCGQIPGLEADLAQLKDLSSQGIPSVQTLLEHLRQGITRRRHVYILLDALDESPAENSRAGVLSLVKTMRQWHASGLHLLVTSRDVPDIRHHLQPLILNLGGESINCRNSSVQQDILQYVSFQVDYDSQLRDWKDYRETIKTHLAQHSDGVFRWVECQLPLLRRCPRSKKHLEKCLRSLPQSLDETYERILCSIELSGEAQRILSLLCYAERPLTMSEIVEALAVDIDELERYDAQSRFTGGAEDLFRICPGLIDIENSSTDFLDTRSYVYSFDSDSSVDSESEALDAGEYSIDHDYDYDKDSQTGKRRVKVVRIAHFSVQEYLLSERIKRGKAADFALSGPLQHGRISKTCLLYLVHEDFLRQSLSSDLVRRYSFAGYAAKHWYRHHRQADHQCAQELSEVVITLINPGRIRERWLKLHDPEFSWQCGFVNFDVDFDIAEARRLPSIYYATLLGLRDTLDYILSISAADINARGGYYGNALQAASAWNYEKIVQMLLDRGADVNAQGGSRGYALNAASEFGHEEIVQILLDRGADVNAQGKPYGGALMSATARSHGKIIQMLLDRGADVNAQGKILGSALHVALLVSNERIVHLLLERGADVNVQGGFYGNALQAASGSRCEKKVQMILDRGVDVNAQGGHCHNALLAASNSGHEKIVQMLLEHGADVNAQAPIDPTKKCNYGNALQTASEFGHEKIVQLLLKYGAKWSDGSIEHLSRSQ